MKLGLTQLTLILIGASLVSCSTPPVVQQNTAVTAQSTTTSKTAKSSKLSNQTTLANNKITKTEPEPTTETETPTEVASAPATTTESTTESNTETTTPIEPINGPLISGTIGQSMDGSDQAKTVKSMQSGRTITWTNQGKNYTITPTSYTTLNGNHYCRRYTMTATEGNTTQTAQGAACRQSDGQWKTMS